MQITKNGEQQEILVHTVSVIPDATMDIAIFNCIHCGNPVADFQGKISKIYPILEPTTEAVVIVRCKKSECKQKYSFQTGHGETKAVRVVLNNLSFTNTFHCFKCRASWFAYNRKSASFFVSGKRIGLPYRVQCPNSFCATPYNFTDIV